MTDRHEDEIEHYRARVAAIPDKPADETTAARVAAPMSEERIAEVLTDLSPDTLRMIISDLRAVAAERDAEIRDLLPMAEAWYDHNCESGGYDPINGDWATEQFRHDADVISRAKALVGEGVPE